MSLPFSAQELEKHIADDTNACKHLLSLLSKEQEALKNREADELERILEEKAIHLSTLEKSAITRAEWARTNAKENLPDAWNALLKELNNTQIKQAWEELKSLFNDCKQRNEINGKMLARNQQTFNRLLNVMRGQSQSTTLYTSSGESKTSNNQSSMGEA